MIARLSQFTTSSLGVSSKAVILAMIAVAHADSFQVLTINGQAEISPDKKNWENAQSGQMLSSGTWIKTGANAKVTILLPDRTQTIIARNSEVQLNVAYHLGCRAALWFVKREGEGGPASVSTCARSKQPTTKPGTLEERDVVAVLTRRS